MKQYTTQQFENIDDSFMKFRSFDLELETEEHIRLKKIIRDKKHLTQLLNEHKPVKVWFQACKFLNPQMQKGRKFKCAGYPVADNLFLYKDMLVIDIDVFPEEKYINNLIAYLIKEGFKLLYAINSQGIHKGMQIAFDTRNKFRYQIKDPRLREKKTTKDLQQLYNVLLLFGFDFIDEVAFVNPRQIFKLPDSFCNGLRCDRVPIPVRLNANDTTPSERTDGSATSLELGERPGISSQFLSYNVSSRIIGTKDNHVLLLDFFDIDEPGLQYRLENLIKIYDLPDIHVFNTGENRWHAYCLQPMQYARILKIYTYLGFNDMAYFLKANGEIYLRFSAKYDVNGVEHSKEPQYVFTIPGRKFFKYSKGHTNTMMKKFNICIQKDAEYIGKDGVNLRRMVRQE